MPSHHHLVCPSGWFFVALTVSLYVLTVALCVLHYDSAMLTVILCDLHNGILCTCSDLWALIMSLFINKMNEWHHSNSVWPSQWLGVPLQCICLTFTLTMYMHSEFVLLHKNLCGYWTLTYMPSQWFWISSHWLCMTFTTIHCEVHRTYCYALIILNAVTISMCDLYSNTV